MTEGVTRVKKGLFMNTNNIKLLSLALAAVLVLFGVNFISTLKNGAVDKEMASFGNLGLDPKEVKGMSIEKAGKTYTLNQSQQNKALSFINTMVPVDKKDYVKRGVFDFSRIVVYRIDKTSVMLTPVAFSDQDIVFDVPSLNTSSYFLAKSGGELNSLIQKATED